MGIRLLTLSTLLVSLSEVPLAQAQSPPRLCLQSDVVAQRLSQAFAEQPVAFGLRHDGSLVQVFASGDGETWTVVLTEPGGVSCIVSEGVGWKPIRPNARESGV